MEKDSTLVAIIGLKDPVCAHGDILVDLLKDAGLQVIICSGNTMENIMSFVKEFNILDNKKKGMTINRGRSIA